MAEGKDGYDKKMEDRTKLSRTPRQSSPTKNVDIIADVSVKKRICDIIIDLHECIQNWEIVNQSSFQTINTLVNLSAQKQSSEEEYERDSSSVSLECWKRYKSKLINIREGLISDHVNNMKRIKSLYLKVKKTVNNLEAIYHMKSSPCPGHDLDGAEGDKAVFNTWTSEDFYRSARSIFNCYTKEWLLKQQMSEHFLGIEPKTEASQTALFVSMWLHQPYIDDSCSSALESMLLESGIK